MTAPRFLLAALLALAGFGAGPGAALAASVPAIQGTDEAVAPDGGGRMLLVYGQNLTKVTSYALEEPDGTPVAALAVVFRGKTLAGLLLPATLDDPAYELPGNFVLKFSTRSATDSITVRIAAGHAESNGVRVSSLDPELRADLDHAVTADSAASVGGELPAQLHDASLLVGSIPTTKFSAYDDLAAEGRVGAGSNQVATGDHAHDTRYPLRTELTAEGTINDAGNPVEWSQLRGVPAGLADGVDDGGIGGGSYGAGEGLTLTVGVFSVRFAGNGTEATVSRSDHDHDAAYVTRAMLGEPAGPINAAGNPVEWTRLKGVPEGFADGMDSDTIYYAGDGINLAGNHFSVQFAGSGTTNIAARSDHAHSEYLDVSGEVTLSDRLVIYSSGDAILATSGNTSSPGNGTTGGIDATSAGGIGIAGHGDVGVLGDLDGDGYFGVWGNADGAGQVGVYGSAAGDYASGVMAYATGYNSVALRAYDTGRKGRAIVASTSEAYTTTMGIYGAYKGTAGSFQGGRYGTAVYAYCSDGTGVDVVTRGWNSQPLRVTGQYVRDLAVFRSATYYTRNVARINYRGSGFFNGGVYSYGADFAESVKVDAPAASFEPGDVMVIDPDSPRRFALSREANSALVAGVISTRPAIVGTVHDVAKGLSAKALAEEVKLGVVGIVPTRVCDQGGEIRIGDLLVTSSVPGHAMKAPANPAPGTIVGKALDNLKQGSGKIEVLLMAR